MKFVFTILLTLFYFSLHSTSAQSPGGSKVYGNPTDFFLQGNIAYGNGSYEAAELYYMDALMYAESAPVHYNLALTLIENEEYPRAHFHLLRAFILDPANPDIVANIQWLRRQFSSGEFKELPPDSVRLVQESTWWFIAAGCLALMVALFVFPKFFNGSSRVFPVLIFVLAGCSAFSLFAVYKYVEFGKWAVVSHDDTVLRVAPTKESPGDAYLSAGDMVKLHYMTEQYYRVQIPNGNEGYLSMDEVISLRAKSSTMAR